MAAVAVALAESNGFFRSAVGHVTQCRTVTDLVVAYRTPGRGLWWTGLTCAFCILARIRGRLKRLAHRSATLASHESADSAGAAHPSRGANRSCPRVHR